MNEAVEPVGYLTISHNNHPYTTYAGTFIICRLEVYCCKLSILFSLYRQRYDKKRYTKFFFPVQFPIFETSAAK